MAEMRRSAGIERVNALTQHQLTRLEALNRLNYLIYTDLRARRLTCEMGLICLLLGRNSREKCRRHSFMAVPICWPRVLPAKVIRLGFAHGRFSHSTEVFGLCMLDATN